MHTHTQELIVTDPVLVDLDEESDGEEVDFDSWEPDPIDADPSTVTYFIPYLPSPPINNSSPYLNGAPIWRLNHTCI